MEEKIDVKKTPKKHISYAKWGYFFILSFFIVYFLFTLIPQILTIYDSFFDYTKTAGTLSNAQAEFCGFDNYRRIFTPDEFVKEYTIFGINVPNIKIIRYLWNTVVMWVIGAVPQMLIALLLALIFTGTRLKLPGLGFFKAVFYMPNLIMASAFAALFLILFNSIGPIHAAFVSNGWVDTKFDFIYNITSSRILVAIMNFLMWFGNTTILLMAGIQSIDESLFESARIDGASTPRVLFDITLPLLKPIVVYVFITSMIGGLQMYDVPQVLTGKSNNLNTKTIVMYLNEVLKTNNYGDAGAISVILFIITGLLSVFVFKSINKKED